MNENVTDPNIVRGRLAAARWAATPLRDRLGIIARCRHARRLSGFTSVDVPHDLPPAPDLSYQYRQSHNRQLCRVFGRIRG